MAKAISLEMGAPMDWATDVQTASGQVDLKDFILRLKEFKFDGKGGASTSTGSAKENKAAQYGQVYTV